MCRLQIKYMLITCVGLKTLPEYVVHFYINTSIINLHVSFVEHLMHQTVSLIFKALQIVDFAPMIEAFHSETHTSIYNLHESFIEHLMHQTESLIL